jgi:uncharacterized protein (TIGR03435 family)
MIGAATDHLWQSTLFAFAAGLLAFAFRENRAGVRYWLWFSSSVKFLVPFALLTNLGSHLELAPGAQHVVSPAVSFTIVQVAQPFTLSELPPTRKESPREWVPAVILTVWAYGFAAVVLMRLRGWQRIRAAVLSSEPIDILATMPVRTAAGLIEPGVVGWRRPILLLPVGIAERLTPAQLEAVLAHELCHIRRRDNLTASIHMLVEAVFWFHPLVWWIGARLVEERERACDESVLSLGSKPRDYAEAILNVCKHYKETPLACMSGVTGSDLKQRIGCIMINRIGHRLSFAKKTILASAAVSAFALPVAIGVINAPSVSAQNASTAKPRFEVASIRPCGSGDLGRGGDKQKGGGPGPASPGRLILRCLPLLSSDGLGLIHRAYDRYANGRVDTWALAPIVGGPAWIRSELWDITAKVEGNASQATMNGPMLQALLEDRFKLRVHRETRQLPVYALTVAKGGPKLSPFKEGSCTPIDWNTEPPPPLEPQQKHCMGGIGGRRGPNITMKTQRTSLEEVCKLLSLVLDRPVIDKTGITGRYDFDLAFGVDQTTPRYLPGGDQADLPAIPSDEPPAPSIFTVVQEQLGLKLVATKGPREYIVIDHVERPSEN